ncbi:MAG: PQQ-binding-like beta-propeller repeat protein [Planctomycetes bacterium]|nr:PQQ-binding-like beta-propeller repeat protein [Planctomycetota bacterium]
MKPVPAALILTTTLIAASIGPDAPAGGGDWPLWGRTRERNMTSAATGIPSDFQPGRLGEDSDDIDMSTTRGVKWVAKLGSQSYGNATVSGGKVFAGTNNDAPYNRRFGSEDRSLLVCLDEQTGAFLWQLAIPKLGSGKVSDWEFLGLCSSPAVEGNRVYIATNRGEVMCLDTEGLADGNDGPYTSEGQYLAGPAKPPVEVTEKDADIVWVYDMREELGVFPHNVTSSSVLILGEKLFATTSNGVDWSHTNIPNPGAPALIMLDKKTGKLLGEEGSGICRRMFHCNWSSPSAGKVGGQEIVVFGAGDGFCYGFAPRTVKDDEGFDILEEIWRFDCNPPSYRFKEGKKIKYATAKGPSEIIATPVIYRDRVYAAIGQDPEHGEGVGRLSCIDATKAGDISESGKVWTYDGIQRTISTVSITGGLLFAADYSGYVHCLDPDTGKLHWVHDTRSNIWGSTLAVDGKVFIGNESGTLTVLAASGEKKLLSEIEFSAPIYSSPVVANGVLYIATQSHLYAVDGSGERPGARAAAVHGP